MIKSFCTLLIILLGLPLSLISQKVETLYVEVRSDANPDEISWTLSNEQGQIQIKVDEEISEPYKVYNWQFQVVEEECIQFDIYDAGGDGLDSSGYYRLRRGDLWYQSEQYSYTMHNLHYTGKCQAGNECTDPLPVASNNMYTNGEKDSWFELKSEVNTSYTINTCKTFNASGDHLDTEIWIYDGCPKELYDGPEGALAVNDSYVSCAPGSGIFGYPIIKGRKYIVRIRNNDIRDSSRITVSFSQADSIAGCMDATSCNYNPFATIDDRSCVYEDCLPDLAIGFNEFISSIKVDTIHVEDPCLIEESCVTGIGEREVIRFTTAIYNIGNADYVVGNPQLDARGFSLDNCHGHWHKLGYAEYLLYEDGGQPIPLGFKNGFCLFDLSCSDQSQRSKYSCEYMGITAGCYDVYDSSIDCQWLDITDVPDGSYTLVLRVNWNRLPDQRGLNEKTYDNNWAQACIKIDRSSGNLILEVNSEDDCDIYKDCFGEAHGNSIIDCNGVCGGLAHFGDMDGSLNLTLEDLEYYRDALSKGINQWNTCNDLDKDSTLTIYDLVLAEQCIFSKNGESLFHGHCNFPKSIEDNKSRMNFSIFSHDRIQKELVLECSSDIDIRAFQIELSGIRNILSVENDILKDVFFDPFNMLYALGDSTDMLIGDDLPNHFKITYDTLSSDTLCISRIVASVSDRYTLITNNYLNANCDFKTSTSEVNISDNIFLSPNPVTDFLQIRAGSIEIKRVEIISMSGDIFHLRRIHNSTDYNLNMSNYPKGIYFAKIWTSNEAATKKILKL